MLCPSLWSFFSGGGQPRWCCFTGLRISLSGLQRSDGLYGLACKHLAAVGLFRWPLSVCLFYAALWLFCFGHGIFIFLVCTKDMKEIESGLSPGALAGNVPGGAGLQAPYDHGCERSWPFIRALFWSGITGRASTGNIPTLWPRCSRPMAGSSCCISAFLRAHLRCLALGDPMIGVLGLIVFRMGLSVFEGVLREKRKTGGLSPKASAQVI